MGDRCILCDYLITLARKPNVDDLMERLTLLTPREREVFEFLGPGLSTREIASIMELHPSTVKAHINGILAKFESDRRTAGVVAFLVHDGRCP